MNSIFRSYVTTIFGAIAGLTLLYIGAVHPLIDDDPETGIHWELVVTGCAVAGVGIAARDNGVTSEQARGE